MLFEKGRQRGISDLFRLVETNADLVAAAAVRRDFPLAAKLGNAAERDPSRLVVKRQVDAVTPLGMNGRPHLLRLLSAEINDLLVAPIDFRLRPDALEQLEELFQQLGIPADAFAAGESFPRQVPLAAEDFPRRQVVRIEFLAAISA